MLKKLSAFVELTCYWEEYMIKLNNKKIKILIENLNNYIVQHAERL